MKAILLMEFIMVMENMKLQVKALIMANSKMGFIKVKEFSNGETIIFTKDSIEMEFVMVSANLLKEKMSIKDFGSIVNLKVFQDF